MDPKYAELKLKKIGVCLSNWFWKSAKYVCICKWDEIYRKNRKSFHQKCRIQFFSSKTYLGFKKIDFGRFVERADDFLCKNRLWKLAAYAIVHLHT